MTEMMPIVGYPTLTPTSTWGINVPLDAYEPIPACNLLGSNRLRLRKRDVVMPLCIPEQDERNRAEPLPFENISFNPHLPVPSRNLLGLDGLRVRDRGIVFALRVPKQNERPGPGLRVR